MPYLVAGLIGAAASLSIVFFFRDRRVTFCLAAVAFGLCIGAVRVSQLVILAEASHPSNRATIMGTNHALEHVGYGVARSLIGLLIALARGSRTRFASSRSSSSSRGSPSSSMRAERRSSSARPRAKGEFGGRSDAELSLSSRRGPRGTPYRRTSGLLMMSPSMSISATIFPWLTTGTTISDLVLAKHWRYRGSFETSETISVRPDLGGEPADALPHGDRGVRRGGGTAPGIEAQLRALERDTGPPSCRSARGSASGRRSSSGREAAGRGR